MSEPFHKFHTLPVVEVTDEQEEDLDSERH